MHTGDRASGIKSATKYKAIMEPTSPGRVAARSPLPRVPSAEVRDLGKHVTLVSPSCSGRLRKCTVYNDRTSLLDSAGRVNAPAAATRLLVASAASDRDDRWCLNRIAGAAAVRPTSGRFNKPCEQAIAWLQALIEARRGMKKPRNDWIAAVVLPGGASCSWTCWRWDQVHGRCDTGDCSWLR